MSKSITELICPICNKKFNKETAEIKRQLNKRENAEFYCSKTCANIGAHLKQKNSIITKICPICGKEFKTNNGAKQATFCSRSCASKGSVNENRRNAGKYAAKLNFTKDTHSPDKIQKIMKNRENWKYIELKKFLDFCNKKYEFEYLIDKFIYDLVLFDEKLIIEFDGPEHTYLNEQEKENTAKANGYEMIRIKTKPNIVIQPSVLYSIIKV